MNEAEPAATSYRPELPDWGAYMRWPQDGQGWIHEEDVELAEQFIPSPRVFCRTRWDGEFYWLKYGTHTLRVRPAMWLSTPPVDLEVGQQVELLSKLGKNDPGVFKIADILFDDERSEIEFRLARDNLVLEKHYSRQDLRPIHVKHHLRVGYYDHTPPRLGVAADTETLDVGDLLGDEP